MSTVSNATQRKRDSRTRQRELDPEYHAKNAAYAKAYRARKRAAEMNPDARETADDIEGGARLPPMNIKQLADKLFLYSQKHDRGDHVIKPKTAVDYAKRLLYMTRVLSGDPGATLIDLELFRDVDRVWAAVRNGKSASGRTRGQPWSLASKIVYMSAITGTLRRTPELVKPYKKYSKLFATLHKKYDTDRKDNKMSAAEESKFITWSALQCIYRAEISNLNTTAIPIRDLALVSLYVGIPPRRAADYQLMYIANAGSAMQPTRNYMIVDRGKIQALVFNAYKTSDRYGTYTIDNIPDDVERVLAEYMRVSGLKAGDILFPTRGNKRYTSGAFSNLIGTIFKKLTGRRATVNILRHAAITHFLRKKRTVAAREAYALKMGHSLAMQALYDRITPPADSGDDAPPKRPLPAAPTPTRAAPTTLTRTQRRRAARKKAKRRAALATTISATPNRRAG